MPEDVKTIYYIWLHHNFRACPRYYKPSEDPKRFFWWFFVFSRRWNSSLMTSLQHILITHQHNAFFKNCLPDFFAREKGCHILARGSYVLVADMADGF